MVSSRVEPGGLAGASRPTRRGLAAGRADRGAGRGDHRRPGGRVGAPVPGPGGGHRGRRAGHPRAAAGRCQPARRLARRPHHPRRPGPARGRVQPRIPALLSRRAAAGAIVVLANPASTAAEFGQLVAASGAVLALADPARPAARRASRPSRGAAPRRDRPEYRATGGRHRWLGGYWRSAKRVVRPRGHRAARVHVRHDRTAQGRAADPPAAGGVDPGRAGGLAVDRRGRAGARAAAVPSARSRRGACHAGGRVHRAHPVPVPRRRPDRHRARRPAAPCCSGCPPAIRPCCDEAGGAAAAGRPAAGRVRFGAAEPVAGRPAARPARPAAAGALRQHRVRARRVQPARRGPGGHRRPAAARGAVPDLGAVRCGWPGRGWRDPAARAAGVRRLLGRPGGHGGGVHRGRVVPHRRHRRRSRRPPGTWSSAAGARS